MGSAQVTKEILNVCFAQNSFLPSHSSLLGMGSEGKKGFAASGPHTSWELAKEQTLPLQSPANALGVGMGQAGSSWPGSLLVPAEPVFLGAGRRALWAGVVGQLRDGAHCVCGGPYSGRAVAETGRSPTRALPLLTLGRAPSPTPPSLRAAHCVSPLAPKPRRPAASLSCGGFGDSMGVWREVGRFPQPSGRSGFPPQYVSLKLRWRPALAPCPPHFLKVETWEPAERAKGPGSRGNIKFCDSGYPGTRPLRGRKLITRKGEGRRAQAGTGFCTPESKRNPTPGHAGRMRPFSPAASQVRPPPHTSSALIRPLPASQHLYIPASS